MRFLVSTIAAACLLTGCSQRQGYRPGGEAVVSPDVAVFTFPAVPFDSLGYKSEYVHEWQYHWAVLVALPEHRFLDRFRKPLHEGSGANWYVVSAHFTRPTAAPVDKSALDVALRAPGDAERLEGEPAISSGIPGARVVARLDGEQVVVELSGREAISRVFQVRRRWLELVWSMRGQQAAVSLVKAKYTGW